ncbi:NrtA/SsuA/CpmA family ABC transporter substrate-binding protein [bacterium]|nr:NrtA/SsuA/CpmA family ABC transporter substrate-binding protein [bacterium]
MYKKFWTAVIMLTTLTGMMTGCQRQTDQIRLVFPQKVNYEPFIIARANGYLPDNVRVQTVTSGIHVAEAIMTGNADIAALGDGPAVMLMARRAPIKIITRYGQGERIHSMITNHSINNLDDLKGKRLGVQQGSSTHGGLLLWLRENHLTQDDIHIVPLSPLDMPDAMATGQIDAMVGSEPWPTHVETRCGDKVHRFTDFSGLGHTFPHVIVVREDLLQQHPQMVREVLSAIENAVNLINSQPDSAATITAGAIGLDTPKQKQCTDRLNWGVGWDESDIQSLNKTAELMQSFGKIEEIPDITKFIALKQQIQ